MDKRKWTSQELELLREYADKHRTYKEVANEFGRTIESVRNKCEQLGIKMRRPQSRPPSANRGALELLKAQSETFARKAAHHESKRGLRIDLPNGPFGILFMGDPHLDDPGCDIDYMRECLQLAKSTPNLYTVCVGDFTNNWIGRLTRLYAHQPNTDDEARALMEWLLQEIPWLFVILGNHDKWSPLAEMLCEQNDVLHVSHGAKFDVVQDGDVTFKIDARHDHKGRSQYIHSFGQIKQNYRGSSCDIIIAGQIHASAYAMVKNGVSGKLSHCIRLSSFKRYDDYAEALNMDDDAISPAVLVVCNPNAPDERSRVVVFHDPNVGAHYLASLLAPKP